MTSAKILLLTLRVITKLLWSTCCSLRTYFIYIVIDIYFGLVYHDCSSIELII